MALDAKQKGIVWLAGVAGAVATIWTLGGRVHDATMTHVDRFFFSTAEAQDLQKEVREAASEAKDAAKIATNTSRALLDYVARQDLKDERAALDRLKGDLADTLLWESQNGANALSRARKADLEWRIVETENRIRCLEDPERPGC